MKLSKLNEIPSTMEMISAFRGYNHNIRIGEGEFYDMKNLTSDEYPNLSPRKKRGIYKSPENPLGLISKDTLCYVDGRNLYINEYKIEGFELEPNTKKTLISMGAYIIIMPDKKYINTADYSDKGDIEVEFSVDVNSGDGVPCSFTMCDMEGKPYENPIYNEIDGEKVPVPIHAGRTAPSAEDWPSGMLWLDTSSEPRMLKIYDAQRSMWTEVTVYTKIYLPGIGRPFNTGDGVFISGSGIEAVSPLQQAFGDYVVIEKKISDNEILLKTSLGANFNNLIDYSDGSPMTINIKRPMPDLDFVIESENRLWGCKYGEVDGKIVNEIYASKLGDFKNWNCFAGISTDSYVASVGTDGQFTGAITYLGYPLFFKEDCIHKVYGKYPANFQLQTTACRGVQQGSSKSLALVNETLFYKSRYSVCAYDGALPVEMSGALGNVQYSDAIAGSLGNKYYISMKDSEDYHLFVYDTFKGMWHKEDNIEVSQFCQHKGNLYYIDRDTKKIMTIQAPPDAEDGEVEDKAVTWSAETGIIGTDSPNKKYISRLIIRLSLEFATTVRFFAEYDSQGVWEHLYTMPLNTPLKTFSIPIKPRRCDHMRLRIEGVGDAKIFSICKVIEQGSDL